MEGCPHLLLLNHPPPPPTPPPPPPSLLCFQLEQYWHLGWGWFWLGLSVACRPRDVEGKVKRLCQFLTCLTVWLWLSVACRTRDVCGREGGGGGLGEGQKAVSVPNLSDCLGVVVTWCQQVYCPYQQPVQVLLCLGQVYCPYQQPVQVLLCLGQVYCPYQQPVQVLLCLGIT